METKGYTLNGIAGRIRDLENKVGGAYYVGLCWLAMARDSGKGAKRRLEDKVFGTYKRKVTSTFRNAWRIADKAFAEGFHTGHRKTVLELGLEEATKFAMECLEAHRVALGVSNMADYEAVCKFATEADIPASVEAAAYEPEAAKKAASNAQYAPAERNALETAIAAMMTLSAEELVEFAARVQARLTDLQPAEQLPLAA
jgi:hypothetical protein